MIKKDAGPRIVDVHQKLVSYKEFSEAFEKIKMFDVELAKLGYLKNSPALDAEMRQSKEEEEAAAAKEEQQNKRTFNFGQYADLVKNLGFGELPQIPYEANNAIVINLFCIDEVFEARSL